MNSKSNNHSPKKYLSVLLLAVSVLFLLYTLFPREENSGSHPQDISSETPDSLSQGISSEAADFHSQDSSAGNVDAAQYRVHVLDVGQGLSVLVQSKDSALLYDGGDKAASAYVVSYLNHLGISKIDYLISSHYDSDHLYGVIAAMNAFEIHTLIGADYVTDSPAYDAFVQACENWNLPTALPQNGDTFPFGDGNFQVFHSEATGHDDENNYSLLVKLTIGENSLLLTGDASVSVENELLNNDYDLNSDILVLGHHGSSDSTGRNFLETVSPEYAIISCGLFNDYGHPHWEIMDLLKEEQLSTYRTDLQDSILFTMTGDRILFEKQPGVNYSCGNDLAAKRDELPPDANLYSSAEPFSFYDGVAEFDCIRFDTTGFTYILNTGSQKFHTADCESVYEMNAQNRQGTLKDRDALINAGYKGCGTCNP